MRINVQSSIVDNDAIIVFLCRFIQSTATACCSAHVPSATRQRALNAGVKPSFLSVHMMKSRNPTVWSYRLPARPTTSAGQKRHVIVWSTFNVEAIVYIMYFVNLLFIVFLIYFLNFIPKFLFSETDSHNTVLWLSAGHNFFQTV